MSSGKITCVLVYGGFLAKFSKMMRFFGRTIGHSTFKGLYIISSLENWTPEFDKQITQITAQQGVCPYTMLTLCPAFLHCTIWPSV